MIAHSNVRIYNINTIERSNVPTFKSKCNCHKLQLLREGYRINMSVMNFSTEEELPIILLKEYGLNSDIKRYHAYMMKWKATLGEFLKAQLEPETHLDKFSIVVKKAMLSLDIHQMKKLVDSQNISHFFFVEAMKTLAELKLLVRVSLGDGKGLQISCKLHFSGDSKHIDKLKDIYRHYNKYIFFIVFSFVLS